MALATDQDIYIILRSYTKPRPFRRGREIIATGVRGAAAPSVVASQCGGQSWTSLTMSAARGVSPSNAAALALSKGTPPAADVDADVPPSAMPLVLSPLANPNQAESLDLRTLSHSQIADFGKFCVLCRGASSTTRKQDSPLSSRRG